MWSRTRMTETIGIQYPIIQAPMAGGATTPALVAAVSNAGGLGSLGAGYMSAPEIKTAIIKIRELTDKPFAVNLFIPENYHATADQINRMSHCIEQSCSELQIKINPVTAPYTPQFEDQMNVMIEQEVPVFSFTFGMLSEHWLKKLKERGVYLIGTATTLTEACLLEAHQVDAIVAQGCEAGGHRGTFIGKAEQALIDVESLVKQLLAQVKLPIIAAGGMMDASATTAMLTLGAAAVQMGTAFLSCHESGINPAYKTALLNATEDNTTLTRVFSGKLARGIQNKFIERMAAYQNEVLDYPIQNALTRSMRQEAARQANVDFMSLWAGQSVYLCQSCGAAELVTKLIREMDVLMTK